MIRRIMHPTDFSSASRAAFTKALEMAKVNRAQLLLIHVVDWVIPTMPDGYISPTTYAQLQKSTRAFGQKRLNTLLARAKKARVRAKGLLLEGSPAAAIVRAARSKGADLVVMGTHGRTGLAKFLLGSVAGRVVSMASCPVLTVRGK